jgi:hypothetical protein
LLSDVPVSEGQDALDEVVEIVKAAGLMTLRCRMEK